VENQSAKSFVNIVNSRGRCIYYDVKHTE